MMSDEERAPYLDFYSQNNVSPVLNQGMDENLIKVRSALYSQLGISHLNIKGLNVLEFGPGNGTNSLYTMSLQPENYVLVDGNPLGIENCKKNFETCFPNENWKLVESRIENYRDKNRYELVICEGLIPNQISPSLMVKYVAQFVAKDGTIIISCHDPVSLLSENLRALLGVLLISPGDEFQTKVEKLSCFFDKDLSSLGVKTRKTEDWVIDNILNQEFWKLAPLFSMKSATEALAEKFVFSGSSPVFYNDWDWYKSITDNKSHRNENFITAYEKNLHNLLDIRVVSHPRTVDENDKLLNLCQKIRDAISACSEENSIQKNKRIVVKVTKLLEHLLLIPIVRDYETSESIRCLIKILEIFCNDGDIQKCRRDNFQLWWGRGMQYVSFRREKL